MMNLTKIWAFACNQLSLTCNFLGKYVLSFRKFAGQNLSYVFLNIAIVVMLLSVTISYPNGANNGFLAGMVMYPGPGGYSPSTVVITMPADGAVFIAPADITIYAGAVDFSARVTRVDFYQGSVLLGSDTYQPYSFTWRNVPADRYTLIVKATNSRGVTTTSLPLDITVINPTRTGCTCDSGCETMTTISPPFAIDGVGEYCWEATSLGSFVLSWNLDALEINGVNLKNCWTNGFPPKINGKYFVYYKSSVEVGHFETR
jgi:hypothetical protein